MASIRHPAGALRYSQNRGSAELAALRQPRAFFFRSFLLGVQKKWTRPWVQETTSKGYREAAQQKQHQR